MFKKGQLVVIIGEPKLYEVQSPCRFDGGKPVEFTVMGANGRGFLNICASKLRLASPQQIAEGWRVLKLDETAAAEERQRRIKEKVEKHRLFLIRRGVPISDTNLVFAAKIIDRELRVTVCYSCKESISNNEQIECKICRWIVCDCGACGCGHPDYGERYVSHAPNDATRRLSQSTTSITETPHIFLDFSEAVAFIHANTGYSLVRNGDQGWLAVKQGPDQ